ncbi:hypothetical protein TNCV_2035711 [Trichonephila clavipes]|nr:hypothetical protein TNCV_2035711 [Trichonephila clavipes]
MNTSLMKGRSFGSRMVPTSSVDMRDQIIKLCEYFTVVWIQSGCSVSPILRHTYFQPSLLNVSSRHRDIYESAIDPPSPI